MGKFVIGQRVKKNSHCSHLPTATLESQKDARSANQQSHDPPKAYCGEDYSDRRWFGHGGGGVGKDRSGPWF